MESHSITLEIIIIIGLIVLNGFFAMTEMAIISSRKARLEKLAAEGDDGAQLALSLAKNPTQMLSAIQIGITLIGIVTGAFSGAGLSQALSASLVAHFPEYAAYIYTLTFVSVISVITFLSLIIGELVPKRIALNSPETIASATAKPIKLFALFAKPMVSLLSISTAYIFRFIGIKSRPEDPITEDEIKILLNQGTATGVFEKEETVLVDRVFRLNDLRAVNVMTPRTQMAWLDLEAPEESLLAAISDSAHSRLPVARGSLDDFVGIIYPNDILAAYLKNETPRLEDYIHQPVFVPESMKVMKLLELLKSAVSHEAVILDEFGGVAGYITLRDIMEELLGHMPLGDDEDDEPSIIKRSDTTWLVDGMVGIDCFKEYFSLDVLPGDEKDAFHTVGGFVTNFLDCIPSATDKFTWNEYTFEVVDMDRMRVDKILITRQITDI